MSDVRSVYADDIMRRLKEEVKTHPDPKYREFLRFMLSTERGEPFWH